MSYLQRHIEIKKQIKINLSADVWELFTFDRPLEAANAARKINATIEGAFNRGMSKKQVQSLAWGTMAANKNLGALDSEPLAVLDDLLNELFKD